MKTVVLALGVAWALVPMGTAHSQAYPNKPVRLIMGQASGGATDLLVRTVGAKLSEIWGQQLVVENRPGAGNTIGPAIAAKANPNGYTLVGCAITDTIAPALYRNLPYVHIRDFSPISLIGTTPNVLVVHPSVPASSVLEFIAYAKANPGKIDYASAGVGASPHLSMELFKTMTGTNIVHVPYKGVVLAMADLLGGRVSVMVTNLPSSFENIKAGKVRALGVTTLKRSMHAPDVPTIHESGVPGFEVTVWYGVCAPSAVPKTIISKINADMVKALNMPDLQQRLQQQGVDASPSTPQQLAALIKSETIKWAKVVKDAGIPPQ